jgi:RNA polymerase sigma-70 factor (ECF subfamily)
MTEQELIQGCIRKDRKSQNRLYSTYAARVIGICRRYIREKEVIDEVVMNTFLIVFEKIKLYKEDNFQGWISRIAVNCCLMELRKKKLLTYEIIERYENFVDASFENFEKQDVQKMLDSLPLGARTVFNLYVIEGYKHAEIAKMLNISEGTSKSQLNFAKEKLKKILKDINYGNYR